MNKIKKLLIAIIFVLLGTFVVTVDAASIKETKTDIEKLSNDSESDVYLIGGTKFHSKYPISAGESAAAGANYVYIQLSVYNKFYNELDRKPKVILYSNLTGEWSIKSNGKLNVIDTEEEEALLEESLLTFFQNNEEKIIEFDPGMEVSEENTEYEEFGIKYENDKFKIPATVLNFYFMDKNGDYHTVDTNYNVEENEMEYGEFYIPGSIYVYDEDNKNEIKTSYELTKEGYLKIYDEEELYQSWDNNVITGYVDEDGNPIDMINTKFEKDTKVYRTLAEGAIRTKNINYTIDDIDKAIEASNDGYEAKLLETESGKTVVNKLITLDKENMNLSLNLNGQTLSRDEGESVLYIIGKNSTLSIYGEGNIENESGNAITVGQQDVGAQNINLYVSSGVTINTKSFGVVLFGESTNLYFNGKVNINKENATGISGNGNAGSAGSNINLTNATITSAYAGTVGLYLPHEGTTTINDNTQITAATAIGIKAGDLNIYNSTITSNGEKGEPELLGNGIKSTGDAIYVEMNPVYLDDIDININSTSLVSVNGKPILVYNPEGMDEPNIFAQNYRTKDTDGVKTYYLEDSQAVVSVGEKLYSINNIDEAIEESSEINPATLLPTETGNLVVNKLITLDKENADMYLNLNGQNLSRDTKASVLYLIGKNSSLTVDGGENGAIIENESGNAITVGQQDVGAQNINLYVNSGVTINTKSFGVVLFGESANLDFSGEINIIKENATGISGNGNAGSAGSNINLTNATITSAYAGTVGLYLPHEGTTTINDNTQITAATAIGIKAGDLNIYNSTITSNGEKGEPELLGNGIKSTGDAIYVEMNPVYLDDIDININSTSLVSVNGKPILVYNPEGMDEPTIQANDYSVKEIDGNKTYYSSSINS